LIIETITLLVVVNMFLIVNAYLP